MKKIACLAVLAATAMVGSAPASAVIVSGTVTSGNILGVGGTFVKTNAALTPNVGVNLINGANIYGLDERQGGFLVRATRFWTTGSLSPTAAVTNIGIGTRVNSHLIFLDAPTDIVPNSIDPITGAGTVTFSGRILGYRWGQATMAATNSTLGARSVTYGILRPLETLNDRLSFSGRTLTYSFASPASTADFVRVITDVPEPSTWAMLISGFAMVGLALRGRRRTAAS
jgi:hypothetical protein